MESILNRSNWTIPVDFIISDIVEYDMKRAGLSIIREHKLLPEKDIARLEKKEKREADTEIGNLNYKIKGFSKTLEDYKRQYRLEFGKLNELSNEDIISVKSDAIFTRKYCGNTQITENILFRQKHQYHAMVKLLRMELYWNEDTGDIDVKGIRDDQVALHKDYLLKDISTIISHMVSYDTEKAITKLVMLMDDYKFRRLPVGYYREFNTTSKYILYIDDRVAEIDDVGQSYVDKLIINYNYMNVLVPLLNLIM